MALATLEQVKTHLGIAASNTALDAALTMWLAAAISAIKEACRGKILEEETRTEYYSPDGYNMILRGVPVQSITSIYEDTNGQYGQSADPFPASTLLTATTDYALVRDGNGLNGEVSRSGIVKRLGRPWPRRNTPSGYRSTNYQMLTRALVPVEGSVKITYVCGYDAVPADVTLAACFEVDMMKQMRDKGGNTLASEALGEYSYSLGSVDQAVKAGGFFLSPATATLLRPYLFTRMAVI